MKYLVKILVSLSVLAFALFGGYKYFEWKQMTTIPDYAIIKEDTAALKILNQQFALPEDEQPQIVTVADPEQLIQEPFFAKAQRGDKLFVYSGAKFAILFRPSISKIINAAPISL